ncbi:MAG TPA: protein kinase [Gaiellaceae bacterium]|nr:protein kinase [Gaiellaceae bacterium]
MHISDDPRVGTQLVDYRIENLLGRGGMGVVYLAEDVRLKRKVALKLLASPLVDDEGFRERFVRESELAASLDHPNIVPVYEAGEDDGAVFIAMRYVDGVDLRRRLRDNEPTPEEAVELLAQIADALDAAHERGLVHGDVKPSNILIASGAGRAGADHAYLVDFGLTMRLTDTPGHSPDGQLQATVDYVAPEQIRGDGVDGRADVYSLGCVLFECLTGRRPFLGDTDLVVLFGHLDESPPSASACRTGLPPAIDEVVSKALAKSPNDRQDTCRQLVTEAQVALGLSTPSRARRHRLAALIVLALLAIGVGATLALRGDPPAAPADDSVVRIDPATNRVVDRRPVGGRASSIAVGEDGFVWVTSRDARTVVRIDPQSGSERPTTITGTPLDVAVRDGLAVVVTGPFEVGYEVVDARTGAAIGAVRLEGADFAPIAVASGETGIWVAASGPDGENVGRVTAPPLTSGLPAFERVEIPPAPNFLFYLTPDSGSYNDAAAAAGSVWLVRDGGAVLKHIGEHGKRLRATATLPFKSKSIAADGRGVWITSVLDDTVARLDPATYEVTAKVPLCRGTDGIAIGAGSVWVACTIDGSVVRIDPTTAKVVATIDVGGRPEDVVVSPDGVWVTSHAS